MPPRGTSPDLIASLPFLLNSVWIFLAALVVQESFCSLQLVFSENCSAFRCIFDVFVGVGEFHVHLLHHLDPILVEIQEGNCHRNQCWSRKTGTVIDELLKAQCRQL